jgi:glycosyl transferase family 25
MKAVNQAVDGVYVLTVKTFSERIAHARRELERHGIDFEFVLEHDAAELGAAELARFGPCAMTPGQKSLVLKHVAAWQRALGRRQARILVFEDDVLLAERFAAGFAAAMRAADALAPGWLVFLGGADTKVPDSYFLAPGPLVPLPIATAEGYVTDRAAIERRLAWLQANRPTLPADLLLRQIDPALGIAQYWLREPIVEQGSVTGLFASELDRSRRKHGRAYNALRNRWNKFQRRRLRGWLAKGLALLSRR